MSAKMNFIINDLKLAFQFLLIWKILFSSIIIQLIILDFNDFSIFALVFENMLLISTGVCLEWSHEVVSVQLAMDLLGSEMIESLVVDLVVLGNVVVVLTQTNGMLLGHADVIEVVAVCLGS